MSRPGSVAVCVLLVLALGVGCVQHVEYAVPSPDRPVVFPRDDYAHPNYATEWWYYTGHVDDDAGNRFGFELVFFRRRTETDTWHGVVPVRFYGNPVYIAHFAVTDFAGRRHVYAERFGRERGGQAGARSDMFRVWIDNWRAERVGELVHLTADMEGGYAIDFAVRAEKPPVIHGENGISRKGVGGGVSYYISTTRLSVDGVLTVNGRRRHVAGSAWTDHEILGPSMARTLHGWDWFSIQFDNDTELMLFHLNRKDGTVDPLSAGTFVRADGSYECFLLSDFEIHPMGWWRSATSGARYPSGWVARVPKLGIEIAIKPTLRDQEIWARMEGLRYWEGSVQVRGRIRDAPVTGLGYAELTGYWKPVSQL